MPELPTWTDFTVPALRLLSDAQIRSIREIREGVADLTQLDRAQRSATLPSGQFVYENRIGWAVSYLKRVDALARPRRGHYQITEIGRQLLVRHPDVITEADLRAIAKPGDEWWVNRSVAATDLAGEASDTPVKGTELDPIEQIAEGIQRINDDTKSELLSRLLEQDPAFFERAVVKLLVAMGYGGTGGVAAATRLVGDGGIDGVIDQDVLGLSKVYVQAKRYAPERSVQRPEVQGFVGALSGKAEQGVLITTAKFSQGAVEYAQRDARVRIILIDGNGLTDLMIRYGVGVQVKQTLHIVEIDEDFFE